MDWLAVHLLVSTSSTDTRRMCLIQHLWVLSQSEGNGQHEGSYTFCKQYLLLRLLGREYWARRTIGLAQQGISYLLMLNTSMAVMICGSGDSIALPEFLLFPLMLADTSSVSYPFIFHTASSAEVQEGCNTLQLMPQRRSQQHVLTTSGEIVTPSIKACHEHCVGYPVSSITSRPTTYSVHLQFFHYKLLSKTFLLGAGTL